MTTLAPGVLEELEIDKLISRLRQEADFHGDENGLEARAADALATLSAKVREAEEEIATLKAEREWRLISEAPEDRSIEVDLWVVNRKTGNQQPAPGEQV